MKLIVVLTFFMFFATSVIAAKDGSLLRVADEKFNHIFKVTSFNVNAADIEAHAVLPNQFNRKKTILEQQQAYFWRIKKYTNCDPILKTRNPIFSCFKNLGRNGLQQVEDNNCASISRSDKTVLCGVSGIEKDYQWVSGEWSKCSSSCYESRIQTRVNKCINIKTGLDADSILCMYNEPTKSQDCTTLCTYKSTCMEILNSHPESIDGYYPLITNNGVEQKHCDMTGGGYTYLGEYTANARAKTKITPWFQFDHIRAKNVSGKIRNGGVNSSTYPNYTGVSTVFPSNVATIIDFQEYYIHTTNDKQEFLYLGDWEVITFKSASWISDNVGSSNVDIWIK